MMVTDQPDPRSPSSLASPVAGQTSLSDAHPRSADSHAAQYVFHSKDRRVYAAPDLSLAHQLNQQTLEQYYPLIPTDELEPNVRVPMLHPNRFLPPLGGYFNIQNEDKVRLPTSIGRTRCGNCFQLRRCLPCRDPCGLCGRPHLERPCPHAYHSKRAWSRRGISFHHGVPAHLQICPSKDQFAVLQINGYIQAGAGFDGKTTPLFNPAAPFNPLYDPTSYHERSIVYTDTHKSKGIAGKRKASNEDAPPNKKPRWWQDESPLTPSIDRKPGGLHNGDSSAAVPRQWQAPSMPEYPPSVPDLVPVPTMHHRPSSSAWLPLPAAMTSLSLNHTHQTPWPARQTAFPQDKHTEQTPRYCQYGNSIDPIERPQRDHAQSSTDITEPWKSEPWQPVYMYPPSHRELPDFASWRREPSRVEPNLLESQQRPSDNDREPGVALGLHSYAHSVMDTLETTFTFLDNIPYNQNFQQAMLNCPDVRARWEQSRVYRAVNTSYTVVQSEPQQQPRPSAQQSPRHGPLKE